MPRILILAALVGVASPAALAEAIGAESFVAETTRSATEKASGDIADSVIDRVDIARVARFTLGRHARSFSESDLTRFESAFADFLSMQLRDNAQILNGARVEITGSTERTEGDAIVTSQVRLRDEAPQTVRWRALNRDDEWRIVDVEVDGIWLAVEQRAQFDTILARRGATIDDAITALEG